MLSTWSLVLRIAVNMTVPGTWYYYATVVWWSSFLSTVSLSVVPGTSTEYSPSTSTSTCSSNDYTGTSDHISSTGDPVGIKRVASYPQLENVDEGRRICNADSLSMLSAPRAVEQRGGFGILAPSQRQNC